MAQSDAGSRAIINNAAHRQAALPGAWRLVAALLVAGTCVDPLRPLAGHRHAGFAPKKHSLRNKADTQTTRYAPRAVDAIDAFERNCVWKRDPAWRVLRSPRQLAKRHPYLYDD
jgi:hypothetical protein